MSQTPQKAAETSNITSILRWIVLIPAVFLAAFVVDFLLQIALGVSFTTNDPMSRSGPKYGGHSTISIAWKILVTSAIYGATFPVVASIIAPSIKKVVAVLVCVLVVAGSSFFLLPQFSWITIVFFLGMNVGAIGFTTYAWRDGVI